MREKRSIYRGDFDLGSDGWKWLVAGMNFWRQKKRLTVGVSVCDCGETKPLVFGEGLGDSRGLCDGCPEVSVATLYTVITTTDST